MVYLYAVYGADTIKKTASFTDAACYGYGLRKCMVPEEESGVPEDALPTVFLYHS